MARVSNSFPVLGMTCASCAISLETFLKEIEGVQQLQVNYPSQELMVTYDSDVLQLQSLKTKASEIGYDLILESDSGATLVEEKNKNSATSLKKKLIVSALCSLPIFTLSMFLPDLFKQQNVVLLLLSLPVIFYAGKGFYIKAWQQLKFGKSTMDTLVALSTGIAFVFSVLNTFWPNWLSSAETAHVYYESAVVIITFILLGRYLEDKAKERTTDAIKQLIGLAPKSATVIRNGEEIRIKTQDIILGDLVLVKPGEKFPVDGKVKRGATTVNESFLTGEPIPVEKSKGAHVVAGSINQNGVVQILALKIGKQTRLAEIIRLVKQAQNSKPNIQTQVDKIASIFVPTVMILAFIAAMFWLVLGPPQYQYALTACITVLIVACPCALGLATPTALMVGIGVGSEKGILIREAQSLESLHKTDTIVLDKTGTLTLGKPTVVHVNWISDKVEQKYSPVLHDIEKNSTHPLAEAIADHYGEVNDLGQPVTDIVNFVGLGAKGQYDGKLFLVGAENFMAQEHCVIPVELKNIIARWKHDPITIVFFAVENKVVALIGLQDGLRTSSKEFIASLHKVGVNPVILSGDNVQTVEFVANQLGVEEFRGNQTPEDKARFINRLQQSGHTVAMVGDGINDAVALTQADIGIAMGSGSDVAMESAGITLMHSNPQQIITAFRLSHATIRTIRVNLFWAFIYNIIAIPIAAGILYPFNGFLLNPMVAGAAMALSSISVLLNSLRLKNKSI